MKSCLYFLDLIHTYQVMSHRVKSNHHIHWISQSAQMLTVKLYSVQRYGGEGAMVWEGRSVGWWRKWDEVGGQE